MRKLIINADDFGRHILINNAVIRGHITGCITSASLMPSGIAFLDAIEKAAKYPSLGIGVHLTLIGEKPILHPDKVPSLVDGEGRLCKEYPQFMTRFFKGHINLSEVRAELTAQIDRVTTSGLMVTHIDSHQHLHVLPGIINIVLDIAAEYKINAIRIPAVPIHFTGGYPYQLNQFIGRTGLVLLAKLANSKAKKRGFKIPNHFFGIVAGGSLSEECLLDIVHSLPSGVSEVMVHPGEDNRILGNECGWDHNFEAELNTVLSTQVISLIKDHNITLTSFKDIV